MGSHRVHVQAILERQTMDNYSLEAQIVVCFQESYLPFKMMYTCSIIDVFYKQLLILVLAFWVFSRTQVAFCMCQLPTVQLEQLVDD